MSAETGGAPIVFYRTVGNGSDRLYRRVLDGRHLPEVVAERTAGYQDDPPGFWWISPDGSVAIHLDRYQELPEDDEPRALEAIPLNGTAPRWRLRGRTLEPSFAAWSPDVRWVSDGRSLTDVATGTTQDIEGPEDSRFLGFTSDGEDLLFQSGDAVEGAPELVRLDPTTRVATHVPWGSVRSAGATWPTNVSTSRSQAAISYEEPGSGDPRQAIRDLRTGGETVLTGMDEGAGAMGFDPTGRVALFDATSREGTGIPRREEYVLYGVIDGVATTLWRGRGGYHEESVLSADGRYVAFQPHYEDASFELVSLDGNGSVTVPLPGDVVSASVLRVIPGSMPPSEALELPSRGSASSGEVIDGATSVLLTTMETARDGSYVARVRIVSPATSGSVVRAETTAPMPARGDTEFIDAIAISRPGHRDVLILVGRWDRPWIYRWTPGGDLRRVPSLGGSAVVFGPIWSPDGRHLAFRAGMSGRRFKVVDAALRLERTITLPRSWTNADLVGWTTDSRRLVFEPP